MSAYTFTISICTQSVRTDGQTCRQTNKCGTKTVRVQCLTQSFVVPKKPTRLGSFHFPNQILPRSHKHWLDGHKAQVLYFLNTYSVSYRPVH